MWICDLFQAVRLDHVISLSAALLAALADACAAYKLATDKEFRKIKTAQLQR
jgi:hypothetical protein